MVREKSTYLFCCVYHPIVSNDFSKTEQFVRLAYELVIHLITRLTLQYIDENVNDEAFNLRITCRKGIQIPNDCKCRLTSMQLLSDDILNYD